MKNTIVARVALVGLLSILGACSQAPVAVEKPLQQQAFGTDGTDRVQGIAEDAGGVYTAGQTYGSLHAPLQGREDIFIRKYDRSGTLRWGRQFSGGDFDQYEEDLNGIATDNSNNVYVLHQNYNSETIEGVQYLRKYSPAGRLVWTKPVEPSSGTYDPGDLAVSGDSLYVANSGNGYDATLIKYDLSGQKVWQETFAPVSEPSSSYATDVAIDQAGNPYLVGWESTSQGESNFVSKRDASGNELWTQRFDSGGDPKVTVTNGNVYVTGTLSDDQSFRDVHLVRFGLNGALRGDYRYGGANGDDEVFDLDADGSGVVFSGRTQTAFAGPRQADGYDGYVFKVTFDGRKIWSKLQRTLRDDSTDAVLLHSSGEVYAAGATNGNLGSPNKGGIDGFLRRLNSANGATTWTR